MSEVNHSAIAETMNEYYADLNSDSRAEPLGYDGGWAVDVSNASCVLGRTLAENIIQEHNAVLIKSKEVDGNKRMWFGKIGHEEVTKTVEVTEERYTIE